MQSTDRGGSLLFCKLKYGDSLKSRVEVVRKYRLFLHGMMELKAFRQGISAPGIQFALIDA
jgi:hypothetical protein